MHVFWGALSSVRASLVTTSRHLRVHDLPARAVMSAGRGCAEVQIWVVKKIGVHAHVAGVKRERAAVLR